MRNRLWWVALLVIGLVIPLTGCTNTSGLDSIQVSPTSQSLVVGQSAQLSITGTYGNANHLSTQNVSSGITWSSSAPTVATVSSSGVITAVGGGSTTITATAAGFKGPVTASASVTVTAVSGGSVAGGTIASIAVIPGSQSVASNQTTQFIAIGTTSSGATEDMTGQVAWASSSPQIATIGANTGLATAVSAGSVTITAIFSDSGSGTSVTGTASLTVTGGSSADFTALSLTPGSQSLSASGGTGQFLAIATVGSTGLQQNVTGNTSLITWTSSQPSVASISNAGLATGISVGTTTITAILTNPGDNSVVTATATISVSLTAPPEPILSLQIIPASITVGNLQDTGQFLAIGTFSAPPYVRDVTNTVSWLSSEPNYFPVSSNNSSAQGQENAGVASAFAAGSTTIIAEYTVNDGSASDGTVQLATASFACPLVLPDPTADPPIAGSCYPGSQLGAEGLLSTLTVYNEGLNTTNWEVTASSATGTPDVLHCGPGWALNGGVGGSVCTATYPVGTTVTLTAAQPNAATGTFGGWSSNCTATAISAAGPNSCTVVVTNDDAVGAIFN